MTTKDFNYSEFKKGALATTKLGKTVRFLSENRDGTIMVAQEKYKGYGFDNINCPADALKYHKDGTRVGFPTPFNKLEMK